jgi:uroporphyrinogen decarboxylase
MEAGADGIFYAVQHAQAHLLSAEEFIRFARTHDVMLLQTAVDMSFNMVHLHGQNIHYETVSRYPAEILNWHDRETAWTLAKARQYYARLGTGSFSPAFCGGLSVDTLVYRDPAQVWAEAADAVEQTKGRRFILGTGCVIPTITPYGNIMTARRSVDRMK